MDDPIREVLMCAGIEKQKGLKLDGVSLLPYLSGENTAEPHEKLFWMTHNQAAVRSGDWKLITGMKNQVSLFNLEADLNETTDVSSEFPEEVQMLLNQLEEWSADFPLPVSKKSKFDITPYFGNEKHLIIE